MTALETKILSQNQKILSVQVSLNGLSFLIKNHDGEEVLFMEERWQHATTPDELLIALEKLLTKLPETEFSHIKIVYATPVHTVIPLAFFDESKGSEYLKFNSKILINDYVAHDIIEKHNLVVLYVPYMNINNAIFDRLGSFDYFHANTILLETFFEHHDSSKTQVFVHVRDSFFDCIVLSSGKLMLSNSFSYSNAEDFLYYLLFTMEQLELDPNEIPVLLCGHIEKTDALYAIAYNYIRNVLFLEENAKEDNVPFLLKKC